MHTKLMICQNNLSNKLLQFIFSDLEIGYYPSGLVVCECLAPGSLVVLFQGDPHPAQRIVGEEIRAQAVVIPAAVAAAQLENVA